MPAATDHHLLLPRPPPKALRKPPSQQPSKTDLYPGPPSSSSPRKKKHDDDYDDDDDIESQADNDTPCDYCSSIGPIIDSGLAGICSLAPLSLCIAALVLRHAASQPSLSDNKLGLARPLWRGDVPIVVFSLMCFTSGCIQWLVYMTRVGCSTRRNGARLVLVACAVVVSYLVTRVLAEVQEMDRRRYLAGS